ncbi:MAG: DUF2079 domain-containing protein [Bacteroidota bacterium]|nr:DUF2079 domain-containing protein [Bacteroidota bacterium]
MNRIILFIHVFFFFIFGFISVLNHYYFRSAGLDYGIANQALYQYAHLKEAHITQLLPGVTMPYLALHVSLWALLVSPFYYVFGSYTLLIFQNLALIFAGVGLVKLAKNAGIKDSFVPWVLLQFYVGFSVYAALAFDYHDNVIGACFIPWVWYYFLKNKQALALLCFVAILISKENLAIFAAFFSVAMWVYAYRLNPNLKLFAAFLFLLSVGWFLLVSLVIMPSLNPLQKFEQLNRYSYMGSSLSEIIGYIVRHPLRMLELFYKSQIQPDPLEVVKQEFLFVTLLSGGIFLLFKPQFLWIALPIFMQKLWNKELSFWGISYHYQIEMAPIISMAIIAYFSRIKSVYVQGILLVATCLLTAFTTYLFMHERKADFQPIRENLFLAERYQSPFNISKVKAKLNEIPSKEAVCAQSNIMPHVANRDSLYHFPFIKDARIILVFQPQLNAYPLSQEKANHLLDSIRTSGYWQEDSTVVPLRVFRRVG